MQSTIRRVTGVFFGALIISGVVLPAAAAYPERPIRLIVPFSPNGPNDVLARLVGARLTAAWGQQVVIDNRPGAGTIIGTEMMASSQPDGYTLLMISASTAVNPTLKKKLPYKN